MSDLRNDLDGHVLTLTLDRPHRRNAFTFDMLQKWTHHLELARHDARIRCVVIRGADDAFCSGVDFDALDSVPDTPLAHQQMLTQQVHRVAQALEQIDKPVIAEVAGPAYGAGMDMALLCDIRIAAETAVFAQSYINVGLVPGDGGCWTLPRIVGRARALELMWTGRPVDADEALGLGIVSQVVPLAGLSSTVAGLAQRIAHQPPIAIRAIKRTVRAGEHHDLATSLQLIAGEMAVVMSTNDHREARRAARDRTTGMYTDA